MTDVLDPVEVKAPEATDTKPVTPAPNPRQEAEARVNAAMDEARQRKLDRIAELKARHADTPASELGRGVIREGNTDLAKIMIKHESSDPNDPNQKFDKIIKPKLNLSPRDPRLHDPDQAVYTNFARVSSGDGVVGYYQGVDFDKSDVTTKVQKEGLGWDRSYQDRIAGVNRSGANGNWVGGDAPKLSSEPSYDAMFRSPIRPSSETGAAQPAAGPEEVPTDQLEQYGPRLEEVEAKATQLIQEGGGQSASTSISQENGKEAGTKSKAEDKTEKSSRKWIIGLGLGLGLALLGRRHAGEVDIAAQHPHVDTGQGIMRNSESGMPSQDLHAAGIDIAAPTPSASEDATHKARRAEEANKEANQDTDTATVSPDIGPTSGDEGSATITNTTPSASEDATYKARRAEEMTKEANQSTPDAGPSESEDAVRKARRAEEANKEAGQSTETVAVNPDIGPNSGAEGDQTIPDAPFDTSDGATTDGGNIEVPPGNAPDAEQSPTETTFTAEAGDTMGEKIFNIDGSTEEGKQAIKDKLDDPANWSLIARTAKANAGRPGMHSDEEVDQMIDDVYSGKMTQDQFAEETLGLILEGDQYVLVSPDNAVSVGESSGNAVVGGESVDASASVATPTAAEKSDNVMNANGTNGEAQVGAKPQKNIVGRAWDRIRGRKGTANQI